MIKGKQIEAGTIHQDRLDTTIQTKLDNPVLENDLVSNPPNDAALQQYNSTSGLWEAVDLQAGFLYFPIWAEENASINNGTSGGFQWAYGNGANTNVNGGVSIGVDCELVSIGLSATGTITNGEIGVLANSVQIATSGVQTGVTNFLVDITPVSVSKGDFVNFQTIGGSGGGSVRVVAWFRYQLDGLVGPTGPAGANFNDQLFGDGVPSGGLGLDGDVYFDNLNGDVYSKETGSWVLKFNTVGPTGAPGADGTDGADGATFNDQLFGTGVPSSGLGNDGDIYFDNGNGDLYNKVAGSWVFQQNLAGGGSIIRTVEVTNTAQTNINSLTTGVAFNSINTTPIFDNDGGSTFTVAVDGITVLSDGDYEVYANFYQTTSVQRSNVGIEFTVDSVQQNIRSASSYIRNNSPHNTGSTNLKQVLSLTANQKVGVDFFQEAQTGTVTLPAGQSIFSIKKIG